MFSLLMSLFLLQAAGEDPAARWKRRDALVYQSRHLHDVPWAEVKLLSQSPVRPSTPVPHYQVCKMTLGVDPQGHPFSVEVRGCDQVLAEDCVEAARHWKFKPQRRLGRAIPFQTEHQLPFEVELPAN